MKIRAVIYPVIFLCCLASARQAEAERTYGNATVSAVVSVYDGDTFRADLSGFPEIIGASISVRILGVDTPEIRGKTLWEREQAIKARNAVRAILHAAEVVSLKNIRRGKYFRLVADVYADDVNIKDYLVANGLGCPYDGGRKPDWGKGAVPCKPKVVTAVD